MNFQILGTGSSHPSRSVTNDELAALVETSDEWIRTRTGIHSRYVSTGETMSDLTAEAALRALEKRRHRRFRARPDPLLDYSGRLSYTVTGLYDSAADRGVLPRA